MTEPTTPTILFHVSEKPVSFTAFYDYVCHLERLIKDGYIDGVTAIHWSEGEPMESRLILKHAPKHIRLRVTVDEMDKFVKEASG